MVSVHSRVLLIRDISCEFVVGKFSSNVPLTHTNQHQNAFERDNELLTHDHRLHTRDLVFF